MPHPYPRVQALARSITAHDTDTYDKVQSLIHWIGAHTRYSENIPPLPAGADTVDEFLFGNRVGFCEQISTSLAVMLRSLGIPAREAVGYVPGGFDPITDLYQVHANDAHAWVQVWFPGYGWQDFDPTAVVPAEPPSPGATALRDVGSALGRIPPVPVAVVVVAAGSDRRARALAPVPAGDVGRAAGAAVRSGPADGPGGPAGPPRRWPNTPGRLDDLEGAGARGCHLEPVGRGGGGERLRGARPAPPRPAAAARRSLGPPSARGAGGVWREPAQFPAIRSSWVGLRQEAGHPLVELPSEQIGPDSSGSAAEEVGRAPVRRPPSTSVARSSGSGPPRGRVHWLPPSSRTSLPVTSGCSPPPVRRRDRRIVGVTVGRRPRCRRSRASTPRRRCGPARAGAGQQRQCLLQLGPGQRARPCRSGCQRRRSSAPWRAPG